MFYMKPECVALQRIEYRNRSGSTGPQRLACPFLSRPAHRLCGPLPGREFTQGHNWGFILVSNTSTEIQVTQAGASPRIYQKQTHCVRSLLRPSKEYTTVSSKKLKCSAKRLRCSLVSPWWYSGIFTYVSSKFHSVLRGYTEKEFILFFPPKKNTTFVGIM